MSALQQKDKQPAELARHNVKEVNSEKPVARDPGLINKKPDLRAGLECWQLWGNPGRTDELSKGAVLRLFGSGRPILAAAPEIWPVTSIRPNPRILDVFQSA